jgi:DNA-binding NarL/FixJ family response regulator
LDPVRVFLLDSDEVYRRGMAGVLGDDPHLAVVGEAATAAQALPQLGAVRPDVAVLDLPLVDADVSVVSAHFRSRLPDLRILVLTGGATPSGDGVSGARAAGHLRRPMRGETLVSAVHAVAAGAGVLRPDDPAGLPRARRDSRGDRLAGLTQQERAVLRLIGEGLTNRQIAHRMGLVEKTVKNYTSHLLAKLGLERRTQAAILATELRDPGAQG